MGIIETLKIKGIEIIKTPSLYVGYERTDAGLNGTRRTEKVSDGIYFLHIKAGDKGELVMPCCDKTIYISYGTEYFGTISSEDEAKKLSEQGKIYSFNSADLYAEYYDFTNNKELESFFKYHYSTRTRKYIEGVMQKIGLTHYTDAEIGSSKEGTPEEFDVVERFESGIMATTEIGKLGDEWIAQTCFQFEIDGFAIIKMHFNRKPSFDSVKTAFAIRNYEKSITCQEVFKCWECGHLVHWLDSPGDISEKLKHLEDKYCGC